MTTDALVEVLGKIAERDRRITELEKALIEEMAARMWADEIFRYEGQLTWAEISEREKEADRQKARAVLGNAPQEGEDENQ